MARDAIAITALATDAGTARPAGTTVNVSNGLLIAAGGNTGKLLIELTNTDATARVATVLAPTTNPNSIRSGRGNLAVTCAQNVPQLVVIESARFAQANGDIHIDLAASFAGTARAFRLPRGS
jgi:hypothetical protein